MHKIACAICQTSIPPVESSFSPSDKSTKTTQLPVQIIQGLTGFPGLETDTIHQIHRSPPRQSPSVFPRACKGEYHGSHEGKWP